jgi:hypothetical protein
MFAVISGDCPDLDTKSPRLVMTHCGFEDTVINHMTLIKEVKEMNLDGENSSREIIR